jgi:hypothetical protein
MNKQWKAVRWASLGATITFVAIVASGRHTLRFALVAAICVFGAGYFAALTSFADRGAPQKSPARKNAH